MACRILKTLMGLAGMLLVGTQAHADVMLTDYEAMGIGANGSVNAWVMGTVTTSNARITAEQASGGSQAYAVDFNTGADNVSDNLSMATAPMSATAIPAGGANALRFDVYAPANTVFDLTFVLSDGKTWATKKQIQFKHNTWQTYTIPLTKVTGTAGTDLAALNGAGLTTNWIGVIVYGGGNTMGSANLSGSLFIDDVELVQSSDVTITDFEDFNVGAFGDLNQWIPPGASVLTSNARITASERGQGVKSWALDFTTGAASDPENYAQTHPWNASSPVPAGGVASMQFLTKAPAGTAFRINMQFTNGKPGVETPTLTQNVDNGWELMTVLLTDLSPPLTAGDLAAYNGDGTQFGPWFAVKIYGAPAGNLNAAGTFYLDEVVFASTTVPVELSSFSAE